MSTIKNKVQLRPLGKLMNVIESAGFNIEYQHDDLVFVNNTAFLFRFDEKDVDVIYIHFNVDCQEEMRMKISNQLLSLANQEGVNLVLSINFTIKNSNTEKEEFQVIFK